MSAGFVYRGLKPVNWCFDCGSALAEAEVEYTDKHRPRDRRRLRGRRARIALAQAFGLPALPTEPASAVIWTTTPWTIPANQALNFHPEFDYALVLSTATRTRLLMLGHRVASSPACERLGTAGPRCWPPAGRALEQVPFATRSDERYDRDSPVYLGDLRDRGHRHRHRALLARLRRRGLPLVQVATA